MTILVGTASCADKSLFDSGKFYPPDVTSRIAGADVEVSDAEVQIAKRPRK